jgi:hypothetical protein
VTTDAQRAQWDAARAAGLRQARAGRPADPQRNTPGVTPAPARVAELARPCTTPTAGGVCGHSGFLHDTSTRKAAEVRTGCSVVTAAGACGCPRYHPADRTDP